MAEDDSNWSLPLRQDIIIPITCHCLGGFSKFIFMNNMSKQDSFASVACKVFAGLVKVQSLIEENADFDGHDVPVGSLINVPIRCACPDSPQTRNGVKYLVTYPILEKDIIEGIASKFGLPEKDIRDANNLRQYEAIFPLTTLLVPAKDVPEVRWRAGSLPGSSPAPRAVIPLEKVVPGTKSTKWNLHVFLGVGVSAAVVMMMVTCGLLICIRCHPRRFQPSTPRSSVSSNVSPDFLDGMSKLKQSLINFSLEELRIATEDFNEASKIGVEVYRGRIGGYYLAIEQMESEEGARRVIYILTKINHLNIVKLEGIYNGANPYLVYEFAENGSLRDCLSNKKLDRQLTWLRRMQIAFDLADALHYLHLETCTAPAFVHQNINTRNVLITANWRAKISGFRLAKPVISDEEKEDIVWNKHMTPGREAHWTPEYLTNGQASLQVDVFAFGVVLLELISGKDLSRDGKILKDSVRFLFDGAFEDSSHCLEKLKEFMDPVLGGDYSLGDAMCLAFLAKGCMEEDPHHLPTMNHVLKALSRIV